MCEEADAMRRRFRRWIGAPDVMDPPRCATDGFVD